MNRDHSERQGIWPLFVKYYLKIAGYCLGYKDVKILSQDTKILSQDLDTLCLPPRFRFSEI